MRKAIALLIGLSSVLMACQDESHYSPSEPPLRNEVRLRFLSDQQVEQKFGTEDSFSRVECLYDEGQNSLRLVAYKFETGSQLQISETLQVTDLGVLNSKSSTLVAAQDAQVPAFVYMKNGFSQIEYTDNSSCSTYYEIEGQYIRGNIMCSALESASLDKEFVTVQFQCRNQDYLLFEVKKEML